MLIDAYLRHFDLVERHRVGIAASRDAAYRTIREADLVPALRSASGSISEMRAVPDRVRQIARRALRLSPIVTFTLADALADGFVLLGERHGRAIALGAIGKLWKPDIAFVPFEPHEFHDFREPKYAKLAVAIWVEAVARGKCAIRFEARAVATDDSARAHLVRWYRTVRPYTGFFVRRLLANVRAEAEALATSPVG